MSLSDVEIGRLRMSRNDKIKAVARKNGTTADAIRHQFSFALFFKHLFSLNDEKWVLLGGNALLIRVRSGRFTKDIDLATDPWGEISEVAESIQQHFDLIESQDGFAFRIEPDGAREGVDDYGYGSRTGKLKVVVYFGKDEFDTFSIDISEKQYIHSSVDHIQLLGILPEDPALSDLPVIPVVCIEKHLADKICALYELHGVSRRASTRYRDLADIVRIVMDISFDKDKLGEILKNEYQRRKMKLPGRIESPHPDWSKSFPREAAKYSNFPQKFWELDDALQFIRPHLDPVLKRLSDNP